MKLVLYHVIYLSFSCCFLYTGVYAQVKTDSSYIQNVERDNVIESYSGIYSTNFSFNNSLRANRDFRLAANSSAYAGIYFNYKWLSVMYAWALPGTRLDKSIKLKFTSLQFRYNTNHMSIHPFYDSYNGLLLQQQNRVKKYEHFRDIRFTGAGIDLVYFFNASTFSHRAANYFSEKQLKSKGSFFILSTPQWQQIKWLNAPLHLIRDSTALRFLMSSPSWISISANPGYQYSFVFKKGLFSISPAIAVGGGVLKQLNSTKNSFRHLWSAQGWITAGYNGPLLYCYFNVSKNYTNSKLLIREMNKTANDMSVTLGYRFKSRPNKILGLL